MEIEKILEAKDDDIMELLNRPSEFKVDSNFEKTNEKVQRALNISDEEKEKRLKSSENDRLARMRKHKLNDPYNRYIFHREKRILHDRTCRAAEKIPDGYFEMCHEFTFEMPSCRECRVRAVIRKCIDTPEDIEAAEGFFNRIIADAGDIYKLLRHKGAAIRCISPNIMEFAVNEDTWRLQYTQKSHIVRLLHNNYCIKEKERIIEKGFHEQRVNGRCMFHVAAQIMAEYQSDYHIKEIQQEEDLQMEMAPVNEIEIKEDNFSLPTAVRIKKFSLLYNRYMFIDTKAKYYRKVFQHRKIRYKKKKEAYCVDYVYGVVICDIPKWYRRKMFSAFNKIKTSIYKEGHGRSYLCGICLIRHLKNSGIPFETYI